MKNLIELRKIFSLKQSEVAQQIGVSKQAYGLYETDKRQASYETLIKLADFFNVSVDYLLGREEKEKTPVFQRKTEIQAYFDELTPYEQGEVIGYIKRMLYNKGVDTQRIKEKYCS